MIEWNIEPLGKYLDFRNGKTSPSRDEDGNFAVFGSNGVIGYSNETNAQEETVIIGRVGTYCGSLHFSKFPCWVTDNAIICSSSKGEGAFWFFLLMSLDLNNYRSGSGQPLINQSVLKQISLPIPPSSERITIASILSSLDDKIELNRRMNETLEAMARAIFKDWFVDFGPTRAKQEGRAAYLPEPLWSLFPDAIDEATGLPQGWKEVTLNHHIQFNPSENLKKGTKAPYLGMNALPTQGSISDPPVLREFTSGMRFRNGDTLFARITPCLENGKTAFIQNLSSNEKGWGSTEFIVMRSISPVPKVFTYLIARDPSFRTVAIQSMTGTSGRQRARTEALENYIFCNPKTAIWECLGSVSKPMFDKIASHDLESRTLAELRDRLLPKLMSGEIRVKDAEKLVDEVM